MSKHSFGCVRKVKSTRKKHHCFGCCKVLPVGSPARYHSGVWEGEFSATYYCLTCYDYLEANPRIFAEGIGEGEVAEAMREEAGEPDDDE